MGSLWDQLFSNQAPAEEDPLARAAGLIPATSQPTAGGALAELATGLIPQGAPATPAPPRRFTPSLPEVPELEPAAAPAPRRKGAKITRDEVLAEQDTGIAQEETGIRQEAAVKGSRADWLADQQLRLLQDQQDAGEKLAQAREDIQRQAGGRMARINQEIEDRAGQHPDPKKYFKDQGTLTNLLTIIGVALGGYQASKTGKNVAMDLLEREVDRNVEAQTQDFRQQLATLQERRGAAKDEQASQLDALEFKVARQVEGNNRAMQMIASAAGRFDNPEIQARAEQMIGQLRQKNATLLEGVRSKAVSEAQEGARIGIASRGLKLEEKRFEEQKRQFDVQAVMEMRKAEAAGDVERVKQIAKDHERAVFVEDPANPGQPILAPRPEVADKLNAQRAAGEYLYTSIDRALDQIGDDSFKAAPLDEQKRRVVAVIGDLENAWSALNEQGVITASDAERYRKLFGRPNDVISNTEQLKQVRGLVVDKINSSLRERTGNKRATWRPDAPEEYSTSVRPPGWQRGTVDLAPTPAASGYGRSGGKQLTREEYQQQGARSKKSLLESENETRTPVGKALLGRPNQVEDLDTMLARLAQQGGLFGGG